MTIFLFISTACCIIVACFYAATHRRAVLLERALLRDSVTDALSRRAFEAALRNASEQAPVALCVLDIDGFADHNERWGRAGGDEALRTLARCLIDVSMSGTNSRATVYRIGGDEFAVILPEMDCVHASAIMETVRDQVREVRRDGLDPFTISCGIAASPAHTREPQELLSCADRAQYHAKRSGRDRVVVYDAAHLTSADDQSSLRLLSTLADVLAAAVDAKDAYTHAHSRNVSDLSLYLARTMGLSDSDVDEIALGGLLHDIGKIGVRDDVLRKPGKLDNDEWEEIKAHCEIGYRILAGIDGVDGIKDMVLHHHERVDGTGYPHGLHGEEIPLAARIISVADAFDSMTAERVYSPPCPPEIAVGEIVRMSGSQFDPWVVEALCQLMVTDMDEIAAAQEAIARAEEEESGEGRARAA